MCNNMVLPVPNANISICPGNKVKLGRFEDNYWEVKYGWYSWGGNRPVCGWYLEAIENQTIKPLQQTDLDDIYIVEA